MLGAPGLSGQVIRPSQTAEVMQWVGAAKIDVAYHRPVARGRELFGEARAVRQGVVAERGLGGGVHDEHAA